MKAKIEVGDIFGGFTAAGRSSKWARAFVVTKVTGRIAHGDLWQTEADYTNNFHRYLDKQQYAVGRILGCEDFIGRLGEDFVIENNKLIEVKNDKKN